MRSDAIGLFWEDIPQARGSGSVTRVMPPIPETGWTPLNPADFPDLSRCKAICIDTETYDPDLKTKGPGWARGVGHIVGISVAVPEGGAWYFPIRHEVGKEDNLDPQTVLAWLNKTLSNPKQPKIGANLTYDVGWLGHEGVEVKGMLYDVQFAEALLQEDSRLALEVIGNKYLGEGKETDILYDWSMRYYGGKIGDQRKNIYRCPPCLVGPYAIGDVDLPLRIINHQWGLLKKEGLFELFEMECKLIYLMVAMRRAGVTVDIDKADRLRGVLDDKKIEIASQIKHMVGFEVNVNAGDSLAKAFDALGIPTVKGGKQNKPVFQKEWLEAHGHPLAQLIVEERKVAKLKSTFVESYILNSHINGKVYGSFHQLNSEGGGTRSGRFASSNPNLQNIPSRDEELAPLVRGLYIPDEGHKYWRKYDYSQIEYRLMIHYAIGNGADEIRARFNQDPTIDYHDFALNLVAPVANWDISTPAGLKTWRKPVKTVNFGLIYGMGVATLAMRLGITRKEAKLLMENYFKAVQFAKPTMDAAMREAQTTGIITTILGRKSRFDLWEPKGRDNYGKAMPFEDAILYYNEIERAYTHKALNRRLQGSSADLMKMAMLQCWEDGVFDETGVPRLTVHDELDFSDEGGHCEAFDEMQRIMQTAIPLRIPVLADCDIGYDWGNVVSIDKFDFALGR
jgi:DNA polymerase I-like protein with 3'-5' exonuclease and polymerase domains